MSLNLEWRHRLDNWRKVLARQLYTPLGSVEWSGFVTGDSLTLAEAQGRDQWPMPSGTRWGAKWECGWFSGQVAAPQEAEGKRLVLAVNVGAESSVFVDDIAAGGIDRQHHTITLSREATPGVTYDIWVEAYAGHGARVTASGPFPIGVESVPEPPDTQAVVGDTTYGVWEEELYQLWVDVETLARLRDSIDPESLRVAEIDRGLKDFTLIYDPELPCDEMVTSAREARKRLAPLLKTHNGDTAPELFLFGHAHIDVAWLWHLEETERKCVRTFGTQLALMDEYPEFKFLQSQPHLYWWMKERHPDIYARIKAAVARGQWIVDGGMWVEADTNLSGGESLIRQFLYGKRFIKDEFGVDSQLLWLPDVFGYSGSLPQIMRGCGIQYFSTHKIFWIYNGGDPFPLNTFTWEGIDGSSVLVHLHNEYNSETDPATLILRWNQRVQKDDISTRLVPFGWGDGGGGPTRDHLEYVARSADLEGMPLTRMATPQAYFDDLAERGVPAARYLGELYFQSHRGTLTSQARTKRGNRKSEFALRQAELWVSAAQALLGRAVPCQELHDAWQAVLLNQFHDIIPGSSIHRVYEEAEAAYTQVLASAAQITAGAQRTLAPSADALTVFNSLSWERSSLVALPEGWAGASDTQGRSLPAQEVDGRTFVQASVPSVGWATLKPASAPQTGGDAVTATVAGIENDLLRLALNDKGEITSIYDKETDRELLSGTGNRLAMYKDVPTHWDAWDLDSMYADLPVPLDGTASIEPVTSGVLFGSVRVSRPLHDSTLSQVITLRAGSRLIEFATEIDWQERHKMLKVIFPVDIHANEAVHEIQYGHLARPNHRSRPYDADRFEVSNHKWTALAEPGRGCAVLNDCKYGVSVEGKEIRLTLLKSALAPDMTADLGKQVFTYAFYAWDGPLTESALERESYELNTAITTVAGDGGTRSLFSINHPGVIIDTVKPAEDDSGDLIVRLYEWRRTATRCTLSTTLPVSAAHRTNMLEEIEGPVEIHDGCIALDVRPFEVITLRLGIA
ncbi:MAG: glycoside hydrolase family 38 C-terminal domain-containing protein [Anaerolineae bacterium]